MTYQEEKEQTKAIAQKIAEAMGWGMEVNENNWNPIILKGDEKLLISIETYGTTKGRVVIKGHYGVFSAHLPYRHDKTEITVSPTKTPEQIAKDIKSRLLPTYQKILAEAQEAKKREDDYQANKKSLLVDVATFIPSPNIKEDLIYGRDPNVTVKFLYGGDFRLVVDLPIDKMKKVLTVIYGEEV
ncbi:MAG: hypothetical protein KKB31_05960 [Nanoarchaeota archaeon]|nr:hypothetical protein [Nanoarchaeota archaeon]